MCGIAGYIGKRTVSESQSALCKSLMRRRGPDGFGEYRNTRPDGTNVILLHSRLSILDLAERSNQPFADRSLRLSLNGELYNYLEIKKELESKGEVFKTTSDTEVLIKAIHHYGMAALDKFEGMWAFALFNEQSGELVLSRDRFSEKPLFLHETDDGIYFASEIKFLRALSGKKFRINFDQLRRYLINGYKSLYKKSDTFFEGVSEVPARHYLSVRSGKTSLSEYWQAKIHMDEGLTFESAVKKTRESLIRAVELRLRADVSMAFCMSGGIDSNSLISIAKRIFNYDVHGFTIASSDSRYDEKEIVDKSKTELKIRHDYIPTDTSNFLSNLRTLIQQHDCPVYTVTYYAHWLLMKAIHANRYKISISGTAADEMFTGYYDHHLAYLYEIRKSPDLFRESKGNWERLVQPVVQNPFLKDAEAFIKNPKLRDHIYLDADLYSTFLKNPWSESFSETEFTADLLRNRMLNELFHEVIPVITHEDDLNAMFYSIENRSPFLDRNLFELAYSIPTRLLIRDGKAKAILRESMRGIVPDCVLDSPRKVGFNASIYEFLDVKNTSVKAEILADSPVFEILKKSSIEQMIKKDHLTNSESKFLFNFLNAKIFLEEYS